MRLRWALGIAATVALVAWVVVVFWPKPVVADASVTTKPADAQPMIVHQVIDGETVQVEVGFPGSQVQEAGRLTVRLIGVQSPGADNGPACYSIEARERLAELLPTQSIVWGSLDIEHRDNDGRWLMYLWTADGHFVNYELADDGFVTAELMSPNVARWPAIEAAQTHAVARLWGLWGECGH